MKHKKNAKRQRQPFNQERAALEQLRIQLAQEKEALAAKEAALLQREQAQPRSLHTDVDNLKDQFKEVYQQMQDARVSMQNLIHSVHHTYHDAIQRLCYLYREMCNDSQLDSYSDQLYWILTKGFEVESFEPEVGDIFDSTLHERVDYSEKGCLICRCIACGWQRNGELIMRAVVDTAEGSV